MGLVAKILDIYFRNTLDSPNPGTQQWAAPQMVPYIFLYLPQEVTCSFFSDAVSTSNNV
jgi:hypothetical protein